MSCHAKIVYTLNSMNDTDTEQSWKKRMQQAIIRIDVTGGESMGKKEVKTNAMRI